MNENKHHIIKSAAKEFRKLCQDFEVPMFLAFCTAESGYQYYCLLPGEFEGQKELGNNPDRFKKFLAVTKDYDKADFFPHISAQ